MNPSVGKINLEEKFTRIQDYWEPKIVGTLNGQQVKLVKFQGEFVWHAHDDEDELFLVVSGSFAMQFRDRIEEMKEGEIIIIPRGVEHCPKADHEVHVLLFEPAGTLNTGDAGGEKTIVDPEWI